MSTEARDIRWFATLRLADVPLVGGKNASLGELYADLGSAGVRVPNGFALTAVAYRDGADGSRMHGLACMLCSRAGRHRHRLAGRARAGGPPHRLCRPPTPSACAARSREAYARLGSRVWRRTSRLPCAVRRRPRTCPPPASPGSMKATSMFAAQTKCSKHAGSCFASLFTDRAIVYRVDNGFDHFKVCAVGRGDEDGAIRHGLERRHLHAGYRVRIPRRRVRHRRLTALARISCKARSIPTNSMSTSRHSCAGHHAVLRRSLGAKQIALRLAGAMSVRRHAIRR